MDKLKQEQFFLTQPTWCETFLQQGIKKLFPKVCLIVAQMSAGLFFN